MGTRRHINHSGANRRVHSLLVEFPACRQSCPGCRNFLLALFLVYAGPRGFAVQREDHVASSSHPAFRMTLPNAVTIGLLAQPTLRTRNEKKLPSQDTTLPVCTDHHLVLREKVGWRARHGRYFASTSLHPFHLSGTVMSCCGSSRMTETRNSDLEMLPTSCAMVMDDTELTK